MTTLDEIGVATARDLQLIAAWKGEERTTVPDKTQALLDAAHALVGVPYALIGGVAVGIHTGVARATLDTDLAIPSDADHSAIATAMTRAGFQQRGAFPHSMNFRHSSGEPVQLAFDPAFDPMIARADHFDVRGTAVPIVQKRDLIAMKERAAADPRRRPSKRLGDQRDIAQLLGDIPDPDEGW